MKKVFLVVLSIGLLAFFGKNNANAPETFGSLGIEQRDMVAWGGSGETCGGC